MDAEHLLTAVKAKQYLPAIWSRSIPIDSSARQRASGQRREESEGDHVD
jgi:hypothetical protein